MAGSTQLRPHIGEEQVQAPVGLLPMVSGSLVEQYVTCCKSGCRCARRRKHGPLYYLYWKEQGRSRSFYAPRERVGQLRRQIQNYRQFQKKLTELLRHQLRDWQRILQGERRR